MKQDVEEDSDGSKGVLERNIASLIAHRKRVEQAGGLKDRIIAAACRRMGSTGFLHLQVVIVALWVVLNSGWRSFDPSFGKLATFLSGESLIVTILVLIAQNRMTEMAEKRAELNLQISLLGEHEITRLLILTRSIATKMKLDVADDPDLAELQKLISPDHVLRKMDEGEKKIVV